MSDWIFEEGSAAYCVVSSGCTVLVDGVEEPGPLNLFTDSAFFTIYCCVMLCQHVFWRREDGRDTLAPIQMLPVNATKVASSNTRDTTAVHRCEKG